MEQRLLNIKLKIGEFSKLCQVTVKTLRYYEHIGLLVPHEVDEWTGYRFYNVAQLAQMNEILHYKSLGFSLEEIKAMRDAGVTVPSEALVEEKLRICEAEIARLQRRYKELMTLSACHPKTFQMENIIIRSLPAIIVASHRRVIKNYNELFALCPNIIGPEMMRVGCECPEPGYCYTINHDKEYRETDIDIEYCEQVTELKENTPLLTFKEVPAVPQALCLQHYGSYDKFPKVWEKLFAYMEEKGYRIIDHPRFNYIDGIWNKESEDEWLTEIQVPIASIEV